MQGQQVAQALADLGMDSLSRQALVVLPLVRVAWADGSIHERERALIRRFAEDQVRLGEEGALLLEDWMRHRPSAAYFTRGFDLLRALIEQGARDIDEAAITAAVDAARKVARAAGGFFGFFRRNRQETAALTEIEVAIRKRATEVAASAGPGWGSRVTMMAGEDDDVPLDAMLGVLVVEDGRGRHKHVVTEAGLLVGSGGDAAVRLDGAAPQHLRVYERRRRFYVEDLSGHAGTYVNGERVGTRRVLGGERIGVGKAQVVFKMARRT